MISPCPNIFDLGLGRGFEQSGLAFGIAFEILVLLTPLQCVIRFN